MTRIASEQLESLAPLRQSLMPDQQLRDLSPEQIADLLAYLAERKSPPAPATNSGPTKAP
jgi:mono/diheme cytochrome c family protein